MEKMVDLPTQVRSASFVPETVNADARTVEMVWSTGATVRRRDWMSGQSYDETLSMDPAHVRLGRLNGGAPLLNSHQASALDDVIGVVDRAWITPGTNGYEGRATVRFSQREDVVPIFKDVKDGILRNVSVAYTVHKYEITEERGKIPVWRAVDWSPLELSAVPIGADPGAGFRSTEPKTNTCQMIKIRGAEMSDQAKPPAEVATDSAADITTRQATQPRGTDMPDPVKPKEETVEKPADSVPHARSTTVVKPDETPAQTRSVSMDETDNMIRQALAAERKRLSDIYDAQEKLKVDRSFADKLVKDGVSLDDARRSLIDEAARRSIGTGEIQNHVVTVGQDEKTTRNAAVENALLHRFDPTNHKLTDAAREWRGLTLLEMARTFLERDNHRVTNGLSRYELATRALHTNSDFPNILANVANKTLRTAYEAAPRTFQPFCRQVTANDFKAMTRVQLGEAPALEKVNEGGEYKRGPMGEGKESYRVETYGKIISISRQVLVNDDLNAFTRIPQLFGVAAANLESDVIWGIITSNPNMGDGVALFHANHKNLAAAGATISVASLAAARKAMAVQTGLDGTTVLNVRPAFILVPAALEVTAEQLLAVNLFPAKSVDVVTPSIRSLVVIAEPRLDASNDKTWYLSATPNMIDTIEYAYLEGQTGVYIETRMGFEVDGVEIKARLDFGAKAIDWRGFFKNPGA
ncbi:MAG: peptidase U37 [Nitrospirae bacterium]|nr:peptidase U37 [Magnetococcales bacterium]HAT48867.1 peptidase U37 [Alphaproteobacteria bacterium]